jgi:hypothetical protein
MRLTFSLAGTAAALGIAFMTDAHAQPGQESWLPLARQCAAAINAKYNCASCAGLWPQWAACTALNIWGNTPAVRARFGVCAAEVERAYHGRSLAYGDRVGDTIRCMYGAR